MTYPLALPKSHKETLRGGKGACCLMVVVAFQLNTCIGFSPSGDIVPEPFDRLRINSAGGRRESNCFHVDRKRIMKSSLDVERLKKFP